MKNFNKKLLSLIQIYNNSINSLVEIGKIHCLIKDNFIKTNAAAYYIWFKKNYKGLEYFYNLLADLSERELFLKMVATKLGCNFVLNKQKQEYLKSRQIFDTLIINNSAIKLKTATRKLKFYNLSKLGYNLKIYGSRALLDKIVGYNQYFYKDCVINKGDYIIDAGGCWGDTALIFANKTGAEGKVWTFEFFEDNINVMEKNFLHNKIFSKIITLVKKPLYDKTNKNLYVNYACADITNLTEKKNSLQSYKTISIDDFVYENKIPKIDFIKMDIEGCELKALNGAVKTLKKYKPKLAIAAYHKNEDCYKISKFLNELNIGYKFYFASYTLNFTDTVIYAV